MGKYYYKKKSKNNFRQYLRLTSGLFLLTGISIILYVIFPIISWQIYFRSAFASQNILMPIPHAVDPTDYTKAENWFQNFKPNSDTENQVGITSYSISIPKLLIENAVVSTVDTDLGKHLVNFHGTSLPGRNGNAVVFGHSTLPQLFNPKDYKTIFANIYTLKNDDEIYATINDITYKYKIFKTIVIDPSDSSALMQNYDNSYLTLVTCTPPGTIWKRLVIMSKLEKI